MDHSNKPSIDSNDGRLYLRPYAASSFGVTVYPRKHIAIHIAKQDACNLSKTYYVVELEDGYIVVDKTGYFTLFGDEPGDDVVFKAEP
jgi:hypothetical protein